MDISSMLRELLRHAVNLPREYDEQGADGRLMKVILDQVNLSPSSSIKLPQPGDEKIRWIEHHLINNPADRRSLEDWAAEVGVSSRTLTRKFRADIRMTFRDWRQRLRLMAAIRQLAAGDSVAKTALDVGFCSDLGIIKMLSSEDQPMKPKHIEALAENWRPWRAYAAIYLWQGLSQ